jgi:hypothetical protein
MIVLEAACPHVVNHGIGTGMDFFVFSSNMFFITSRPKKVGTVDGVYQL